MARKKAVTDDPVAPAATKKPAAKKAAVQVAREMIAKRAYELYVKRGRVDGFAEIDWHQAEKELKGLL